MISTTREFSMPDVRFITNTPENLIYAHARHGLIHPRLEPKEIISRLWFRLEEVIRLQLVEQLRRIGVRPARHADVINLCVLGALGRHGYMADDETGRALCPAFRFLVVSRSGPVYFEGSEPLSNIKSCIAGTRSYFGNAGELEDVMIVIDLDAMLQRIAAKIDELDQTKAEGRTPAKGRG